MRPQLETDREEGKNEEELFEDIRNKEGGIIKRKIEKFIKK